MCKHVVLVPIVPVDSALQKKTCKPAVFGRVWSASRRALNLEHTPAHQFACCQWQTGHQPATAYVIYRWVLFLAVTSTAVASFANQRLPRAYKGDVELNHFKWFIYLTNWGFMCIILQSGLALLVVHRYKTEKNLNIYNEEEDSSLPRRAKLPLLCRAYWLSHIVATDLAFVITLIYWTLIHDPKIHEITILNLLVHGGNSLVMLCELAVTSHPLRPAQALYGAGAGLVYGVFSAFYWAVGGTDPTGSESIYPALNWNKPGNALGLVGLCAVVLITAHTMASCLAAVRTRLAARLLPARAHDHLTLPTH